MEVERWVKEISSAIDTLQAAPCPVTTCISRLLWRTSCILEFILPLKSRDTAVAEFWNDCHIFCEVFSLSTCKRSSNADSFSHSSKHFFSQDDNQPSPGQSESVSLCSAISTVTHLAIVSPKYNFHQPHQSNPNNIRSTHAQCRAYTRDSIYSVAIYNRISAYTT